MVVGAMTNNEIFEEILAGILSGVVVLILIGEYIIQVSKRKISNKIGEMLIGV